MKRITWYYALTMVVLGLFGCHGSQDNDKVVKVVSWGGQFQTDLMKYWLKPASESAQVKLNEGTWDGDYAALTSKIKKNINAWDLVHVEDYYINVANKDELFTKIPADIKDNINPQYAKNDYAVPILEYSYILAARKDQLKNTHIETLTWSSFWDTQHIAGKRGLRDFPLGNIEIALLSEGKDINKYLYDDKLSTVEIQKRVQEALTKLSQIKSDIVWYTTGDQLQKSMESGETTLTAAWSGRVASAYKTLCKNQDYQKCALGIVPNTALISVDWWVVPKNSAHAESAIALLRAAYSTENLNKAKAFANNQGYSLPVSSFSLLDKNELYFLDAGSARNHSAISKISEDFWSKNFNWINKAWEEWRFK